MLLDEGVKGRDLQTASRQLSAFQSSRHAMHGLIVHDRVALWVMHSLLAICQSL